MKLTEKTLRKHVVYQGKIVNLRRDDAELENGRQVLARGGGAPGRRLCGGAQ